MPFPASIRSKSERARDRREPPAHTAPIRLSTSCGFGPASREPAGAAPGDLPQHVDPATGLCRRRAPPGPTFPGFREQRPSTFALAEERPFVGQSGRKPITSRLIAGPEAGGMSRCSGTAAGDCDCRRQPAGNDMEYLMVAIGILWLFGWVAAPSKQQPAMAKRKGQSSSAWELPPRDARGRFVSSKAAATDKEPATAKPQRPRPVEALRERPSVQRARQQIERPWPDIKPSAAPMRPTPTQTQWKESWTETCAYGRLFRALRDEVIARSNGRCVGCGNRYQLEIHHITPDAYPCGCDRATPECNMRPRLKATDLVAMCRQCHKAITEKRRSDRSLKRWRRNGIPDDAIRW